MSPPAPVTMTKAQMLYWLQGGDPATILLRNFIETVFELGIYPVAVLQDGAPIVTEAGATRTLTNEDHDTIIDFTSGSAVTVTVPEGLTHPFVVGISQGGAGQVTLDPDGAVTIDEIDGNLATAGQFAMLTLKSFAADEYRIFGRTA